MTVYKKVSSLSFVGKAIVASGVLCMGALIFLLFFGGRPAGASSDLAGYWNFDEGSGVTAFDSSANGNTGTLINGTAWSAGQYGSAVDLDGANDVVSVDASSTLDNLDEFSVAFWFYADSTGQGNRGRFFEKTDAFKAYFSNYNSKIYFSADRWGDNSGTWRFSMPGSASLVGAWHHAVVTYSYSDSSNNPSLYIDGQSLGNMEVYEAPVGALQAESGGLHIGNNESANRSFEGRMDDFRVYSRVLSASEVSSLASNPPDDTPPSIPSNFDAEAVGQAVELSWTASEDIESGVVAYNIYRDTQSGTSKSLVGSVSGSLLAYVDSATSPNTTYYYEVSAVNAVGLESGRSSEDSALTGDTAPFAPVGLSASFGDQQLSLDWDDNQEGDLAGYRVYRSLATGGPYTEVTTSLLGTSSYVDTGLTNDTTYYYVVTAEDVVAQESAYSNEANGTPDDSIVFAVIGDFGDAGPDEANVANLVKSWDPAFIVTVGDNNYPDGATSTMDANIGQYYREFIYPYVGSYGSGSATNRFWPALGNHDWNLGNIIPHQDYFELPGNERYYDVEIGPVHIFILDADEHEPDGVEFNSVQGQWLQSSVASSTSPYKFVFMHRPPYSSGQHQSKEEMQWPYKEWGLDAVFAGHDHVYERIIVDDFPYFVNGLGGRSLYDFGATVPGSVVRYNDDFGAMRVEVTGGSAFFEFINVNGQVIDSYAIVKDTTPPLIPENMVANTAGETIEVSWNASSDGESGVDLYRVYRGTVEGGLKSLIVSVDDPALSYVDSAVNPGVVYYYVVTAVNGVDLESGFSNEASATAQDNPPGAPSNLAAISADQQISLDWNDNQESDLAGYRVYRSLATGGPYTEITTGLLASSSYLDTGLTNDTTYYYVVSAEDTASQESGYSNEASGTPAEEVDLIPGAPTGLAAVPGDEQVSLDWNDNVEPEGDLAGYRAYRSLATGGPYTEVTTSLLGTSSYVDTGLTNDTIYYYVVTAEDIAAQESAYSAEVSGMPTEATDLAGHWRLDEGSGSSAADSSGNGSDGTLVNNPAWTTGTIGNALDFDGLDDRVDILASSAINNLDQFSVAVWFFADSTGEAGQGRFIERSNSMKIRFSNYNSKIYFDADRWSGSDGKWRASTQGGNTLLGAWNHLVITYDYSSGANDPSMYINGVPFASIEEYGTPSGTATQAEESVMYLGNNSSGSRTFDGRLDEVQIYNRVLSPAEVSALYAN